MGLELSKELLNGVDVLYWNIGASDLDFVNNVQHVHLDGYLTKAARDSGKKSVTRIMETLNLELNKDEVLHNQIYNAIKILENWENATDILE